MGGEEELHPCVGYGLGCHQVFGFFTFAVWVNIHFAHVEVEEDDDWRRDDPFAGACDSFLNFILGKIISFEIVCELDSHCVRKFCFDGFILHYGESPGLTIVRGGGEGCSGKDVLDNRIRHRVRFEAADRAASPQEVVEVSCACQSESA